MKLGFSKEFMKNDLFEALGVLIATFFAPWWSFALVAWVAGYDRTRRGGEGVLPPALVATFTWVVVAFVRDAMNGFRISKRIGGFFGLPHGSLLYLALCVHVFAISALAAASGSQLGRVSRAKAAR